MSSFESNENIHKKEDGSYYVVKIDFFTPRKRPFSITIVYYTAYILFGFVYGVTFLLLQPWLRIRAESNFKAQRKSNRDFS